MTSIFKRKRKQCESCLKTFYKPSKVRVTRSTGWSAKPIYDGWVCDVSETSCPHCNGFYIVV